MAPAHGRNHRGLVSDPSWNPYESLRDARAVAFINKRAARRQGQANECVEASNRGNDCAKLMANDEAQTCGLIELVASALSASMPHKS
jgi:hypothetical protein